MKCVCRLRGYGFDRHHPQCPLRLTQPRHAHPYTPRNESRSEAAAVVHVPSHRRATLTDLLQLVDGVRSDRRVS